MRPALLAALLLLATPLAAQQPPQMPKTPPGAPIPARAVAGTYRADPAHTQILFRVNHMGFSEFDGAFADAGGTLVLDPRRPESDKVSIEVPIDHIRTTSAELDKHLKTADFFDTAKFPTASFVSTKVVAHGMSATISGNLTLKGVTRPVVLEAHLVGAGTNFMTHRPAIGFRATTTVKRSAFGLGYGVPIVSDEVALTINAAFDPQP